MRRALLQEANLILKDRGISSAQLDARLLLQHALGITHEDILRDPDQEMSGEQKRLFMSLVARRAEHEPVSRIVGKREFWGLNFVITPETLDPRPDSETLIETALRLIPDRGLSLDILDLGTGSGCLLIALLYEYRNSKGVGVDQSRAALDIADQNALFNRTGDRASWIQGDWWQGWRPQQYDLVISNPPYIPQDHAVTLEPDVLNFDPHAALFGGPDGMDCYRLILRDLKDHLKPSGLCLFEIGYDQADSIVSLAKASGMVCEAVVPDIGGNPRCAVLRPA